MYLEPAPSSNTDMYTSTNEFYITYQQPACVGSNKLIIV